MTTGNFGPEGNWIVAEHHRATDRALIAVQDGNDVKVLKVTEGAASVLATETNIASITKGRNFDLAMERNSGRILFVIGTDVAALNYRVWNGFELEVTRTAIPGSQPDDRAYWVKLEPSPVDDSIVLVALTNSSNLFVARWTGSEWTDQATISANAASKDQECFDVAYDVRRGEWVLAWGNANNQLAVRTLSVATVSAWALPEKPLWVTMASNPSQETAGLPVVVSGAGAYGRMFWVTEESLSPVPTWQPVLCSEQVRCHDVATDRLGRAIVGWRSAVAFFVMTATPSTSDTPQSLAWISDPGAVQLRSDGDDAMLLSSGTSGRIRWWHWPGFAPGTSGTVEVSVPLLQPAEAFAFVW